MFQSRYGLSPEEVLKHGAIQPPRLGFGNPYVTMPKFKAEHLPQILEHIKRAGGDHPIIGTADDWKRSVDEAMENRDAALNTPHDKLVQSAVRRYQWGEHQIGEGGGTGAEGNQEVHHVAASLLALEHTLRNESRPNDLPLFRGMSALRTPNQDLTDPDRIGKGAYGPRGFVSFSENKDAAKLFVRRSRNIVGQSSTVYQLDPGEGSGIRLSEYGGMPREVMFNPEKEWLITGISRQFTPKKREQ